MSATLGVELLLAAVCVNSTYCPIVYDNPLTVARESAKHQRYNQLARELNGKHLRIGTIDNYPYSWTEKLEDGSTVGMGVAFELVEILQHKFNFTYELVTPLKNWEGGPDRLENSLLGLVNGSQADMAAAFLPVLTDSQGVVRFTPLLNEGKWVMMMKRPAESAAGSGLLAPFEQYVWYLILVAVFSFGPCITLVTRVRRRLAGKREKTIAISHSMWFVYGAFIKQGTSLAPDANSTRILFATWWIFIILLSSFYTANLTAFLTLSKFTLAIEDAEDLYKKNYRWTATEGGAVEYVVTDPDEFLFYLNKMVKMGRGYFRAVANQMDFLRDVSAGVVLVHDKISVDHLMYADYLGKVHQGIEEKDRCTYVITNKQFMTKMHAFAYPMNTTLNYLFDPVMEAMVESGIIKHMVQQNLPSTKICPLDLQSKERRLRNSDLNMTYALAGIGIAAAAAAFIGELFIKRCYFIKINTTKKIEKKWQRELEAKSQHRFWDSSKPPPYESIFGLNSQYKECEQKKMKIVNGRDYMVVKTVSGDERLIPVRTPSALLFGSKAF